MKKLSKIISTFIIFQFSFVIFSVVFVPVSLAEECFQSVQGGAITGGFASPNPATQEDNGGGFFAKSTYTTTITWETDQPSNSNVAYSCASFGGKVSTLPGVCEIERVIDNTLTKQHSVTLTKLSPGFTYNYYIYSENSALGYFVTTQSVCGWVESHTFTTPSEPNTQLPQPPSAGVSAGISGTTPPPTAGSNVAAISAPQINLNLGGDSQIIGDTENSLVLTTAGSNVAAISAPQINLNLGGDSQIIGDTENSLVLTLYRYALGIVGIIALGAIMYGGILRITSAGNPSKISEGNGYILGAILGIALLGTSALIFNTINPQITEVGENEKYISDIEAIEQTSPFFNLGSIFTSSSSTTYSFCGFKNNCPPDNVIDLSPATDMDARNFLKLNGIKGTDRSRCEGQVNNDCINFDGMKGITLTTLAILSDQIGGVYVTGGTEPGHAVGTYSHGNGYKFDLRMDDATTNYIERHMEKIDNRSDGAIQYQGTLVNGIMVTGSVNGGVGVIFAKEASASGGPHWDVVVSTKTQCIPGTDVSGAPCVTQPTNGN